MSPRKIIDDLISETAKTYIRPCLTQWQFQKEKSKEVENFSSFMLIVFFFFCFFVKFNLIPRIKTYDSVDCFVRKDKFSEAKILQSELTEYNSTFLLFEEVNFPLSHFPFIRVALKWNLNFIKHALFYITISVCSY